MYVSWPILGLACISGGLILTFAWPLGRPRRGHIFLSLSILGLFVFAGYCLNPANTWTAILIGLGAGVLCVLYRDVRRFLRYFHGKVYRMTHPYYWYGRYYRRRRHY